MCVDVELAQMEGELELPCFSLKENGKNVLFPTALHEIIKNGDADSLIAFFNY